MEMLKLAIAARVPFIAVKSDDLLYSSDVISFIAGEEAQPFFPEAALEVEHMEFPEASVLWTSGLQPTRELYFKLAANKKTLVFINPEKMSTMFFNGGTLLPPKEMTYEALKKALKSTEKATEVLTAFGGLTLKDVLELIQLTHQEFGQITAENVNKVRQGYITKLKGMVQVDTTLDYYDCPGYLGNWLEKNLYFFEHDVHQSLRPRGLLFDGPPGTGKTAGAKAIANAMGVPLFRLDIGGMKDKYVGNSEGNLQAALQTVDQMSPCVVIFDEIEKMFGESHDSGVTSSMLGTLLWWLQEHESKVLCVMTTNSMKTIPPELYREGRIDKVMTFKGLESEKSAIGFATEAAQLLLKKVKIEGVEQIIDKVSTQLKAMKYPVSQSSVMTLVQSAVKEEILKGEQK